MNPGRESADRSSKRGDFQASVNVRFSHHVSPRIHHVFTIKKPRSAPHFLQNPQQNATPPANIFLSHYHKKIRVTEFDDTIVAISTPPGRGGIGIVRLSGPAARAIAEPLLKLRNPLAPAQARFAKVVDSTGEIL